MKRKNILKFFSLLGLGSFATLAVASCTQQKTQATKPDNSSDKELNEAKAALTSLIRTKNDNEQLYTDYAKIQVKLTSAYTTAQTVLDNSGSTLQNIKDAQRDLENAISNAKSSKQTLILLTMI
ncbi:variably expressed lipoprotein and hemagglutinin (VlhA) family domain protein [Mycoplasmoides gallisepticum str. F]|uniref:hypothetical protein n=1 Tax=Mycoplasmoides gallisepticum TaxID=2096 RepID=UPI0001C399AB|nr:hypothetical protein [Mycoplasmoides gallisepticum]ADC31569.1 variably expressed lipoprotein and hemagglutinin (VlhA) family domain protein [Mycoplasmoides gallisepticum str. F]